MSEWLFINQALYHHALKQKRPTAVRRCSRVQYGRPHSDIHVIMGTIELILLVRKDQHVKGKFHFVAETFVNLATGNWSGSAQRWGRYESTDPTLSHWILADPAFALDSNGEPLGGHSGGWFLPVPGSHVVPGASGRYSRQRGCPP